MQRDPQYDFNRRNNLTSHQQPDLNDDLIDELKCVFDTFVDLYHANDYFEKPLWTFVKQAKSLKTNSALESALQCFGKYSEVATTLGKRKKGKQSLSSCKSLGVQPTALARRKVAPSGQPTKQSKEQSEKSGFKMVPFSSKVLPRQKALHSISACVKRNEALGKTYSAK